MQGNPILRGLLLAALAAMSAHALDAQTFSGFVSGGTSSMFYKYSFVEYNNAYHIDYNSGPQITIGGEGHLTPLLGVELALGVARNQLEVNNSNTGSEMSDPLYKERLSGDLVVHLPGSFLHGKPYLVLGPEFNRLAPYGATASAASTPGFLNDPRAYLRAVNKFGLNVGAGLETKIHSNLGLRLDLRDHLFASPRYGLPASANIGAYFPVTGSVNNVEISIGLVYHFQF